MFQNTVCLAPMVRAGSLPLRILSLDYGANLVWSEEMIDRKLSLCKRSVNDYLGTIDFSLPSRGRKGDAPVVLFRTCALERGKVILQLGTADPTSALAAAKLVEGDVAAIDVNMGCPKTFSIQGNMGAALLGEPELACDIIRTLKAGLSIPVTAKIRFLDTTEHTIDFVHKLIAAGVDAVTVHMRQRNVESNIPANWEPLKAIVDACPGIPILANGDIYTQQAMKDIRVQSGCSGVMLGRPVLLNASCLRAEGPLPILTVFKDYVRRVIEFDPCYQVVKYTIMEMMVSRRHTPHILDDLKRDNVLEFGRMDPAFDQIMRSRSIHDICKVFEMENEYEAAVAQRQQRNQAVTNTSGATEANEIVGTKRKHDNSDSDPSLITEPVESKGSKAFKNEDDLVGQPIHRFDPSYHIGCDAAASSSTTIERSSEAEAADS